MKLHLPCALRSALIACFALACTTPAWASWGDNTDSFTISAEGGRIYSIVTADTTSTANNGYFLRAAREDGNEDPASLHATVELLSLHNAKDFTIQAEWNVTTGHVFKSLTIESIGVTDALATGTDLANVIIGQGQTVYLGVAGVPVEKTFDMHIKFSVDGTLGVDYANWDKMLAANSVNPNGTVSAIGDGGNIAFFGLIDTTTDKYDFSNYTEVNTPYVIEDILGREGISLDNFATRDGLTLGFAKDTSVWGVKTQRGYSSELVWNDDQLDMTVTYIGVGRQEIYAEGVERPTGPEIPTDFVADKETANVLTQITTNTDTGDKAGSGWTIQVYGMVNKPTDDSTDIVLLTNTNQKISDKFDKDVDLGNGNYAIYLTSDGTIYLFRSGKVDKDQETAMQTMATYWDIGHVGTDWTTLEFSFNLSYKDMDGKYDAIVFDPNDGKSYVATYDADGNTILTSIKNGSNNTDVLKYGWARVDKKLSQNDLTDSIYTRLTENSYIALTSKETAPPLTPGTLPQPGAPVVPENINWYIVKNASATVEGLWNGDFVDYDTLKGTKMKDEENIVFTGGVLETRDYTSAQPAEVTLNNKIKVEDGGIVRLAPGLNSALVITEGDSALKSADGTFHGLEIGGKTNSKVVLKNVTIGTPKNLSVLSGAALELSGSSTYTIDMTDSTVSIDQGASLGVSGGGKLVVQGTETGSKVNQLFSTDGTVQIKNNVTANLLVVDKLEIAARETHPTSGEITVKEASLKATNGISAANKITVGRSASLSSDASIAAGEISTGVDSQVSATNHIFSEGSITVGSDASLKAGGYVEATTITLTAGSGAEGKQTTLTAEGVATTQGSLFVKGNTTLTATDIDVMGTLYAQGTWGANDVATILADGLVTATGISATNGGSVNIGSTGVIVTTGKSTIYDSTIESSGFEIKVNPDSGYASASITGLQLSATQMLADAISDAAIIVKAPVTKARASYQNVISLGTATKVSISNETSGSDVHIVDTEFVNSTVTVTDATLKMTNTSLDDKTTVEVTGNGATADFNGVTMVEGSSFTVGNTTFEVTDKAEKPITISGDGTDGSFVLTGVTADLTDYTEDKITSDGITFLTSQNGGTVDEASCAYTLKYAPGIRGEMSTESGELKLTMWDASPEIVEEVAASPNASAAAGIISESAQNGTSGVIENIYDYIRNESEASYEQRRNALDALTSGSITMLADSQRRGVVNTVNNLRNRIVQMGNPQNIEWEKNIHAWIEADGSYNDVDQDGGCAGYEYQTWGGTVGVHADAGDFSFGAAVSAAYGDLTAHSEDRAEGDHDSYALSAFVRHQHGSWMQMGILSLGRNEIEMERSVDAPKNTGDDASYKGEGSASGHTITAYYEAGYTISLNEDATQVIQPLASIMLTSARMGDFTEQGTIGNAGVCSDTQDYFYGTLGLGARYQVVLAEDVNERLSFLELRAKLVQDFGDETNEATVSFSGVPGQTFTVRGADVGRTGIQFGAGLSVPLGIYETFFADIDADIRSGATSVNGSVGVRVEF